MHLKLCPHNLSQCVRQWLYIVAFSAAIYARIEASEPAFNWTTFIGRASVGFEDGARADARFNEPWGLAADASGNIYVADAGNNTIRKISANGTVSTFAGATGTAGSADGPGTAARFNHPQGLAVDLAGNVYVADTGNHIVRKITPTGMVTTLAGQAGKNGTIDGPAAAALFDAPDRLTVDLQGAVYLSNHGIRKISAGQVQTIPIPTQATDPVGTAVTIKTDRCPAIDASGQLYFTTSIAGEIFRYAPGGASTVFRNSAYDVYNPGSGSYYASHYVDDTVYNTASGNLFVEMVISSVSIVRERKVVPMQPDGTLDLLHKETLTNYFGRPSPPRGVTIDPAGKWYYTREGDDAVMSQGTAFAGTAIPKESSDGEGNNARLQGATLITFDPQGNLWVAESPLIYDVDTVTERFLFGTKLRKVTANRTVHTPPQTWLTGDYYYIDRYPTGLTSDPSGNIYLTRTAYEDISSEVFKITPTETISLYSRPPNFLEAHDLVWAPSGNLLTFSRKERISLVDQLTQVSADSQMTVLAGGGSSNVTDGTGSAASFDEPYALVPDNQGNFYFLDSHTTATSAEFYIRKVSATGTVTTISPKMSGAAHGLALDSKRNFYLSYPDRNVITRVNANWEQTIIGGTDGLEGSRDGNSTSALFERPGRMVIDAQDNLYVLDGHGTTVRRGSIASNAPAILTQPVSQTVTAGSSVQFSIVASGDPTLTYQWYFNGSPFGGATSDTLSFSNARSSDAGDYTVVVTNSLGSVTSNKASLVVNSTPSTPPPTNNPGNSGSGGGAINCWFVAVLSVLATGRRFLCVERKP